MFAALSAKADDMFQPRLAIEAGLSYVDGLLVPELDTMLKATDQANFWSLDTAITTQLTGNLSIETGLTYYEEHYSEQREYNYHSSAFYADAQYQRDNGTVGVNFQRNEFNLAGSSFMQQNSMGAYYSALFADHYFLLLNLAGTDKTLPDYPERNSTLLQTGIALFYLPTSGKSIVSLSLGTIHEGSQDDFYSNKLYSTDLSYRLYLNFLSKSGQLDSGWKYQTKQFELYEIADILRKDTLNEIYSTLAISLNNYLSSTLALRYSKQESTINDFSYQEASIRLSFTLAL